MIQVLDNVFDEKDIDTFYGEFRDFTAWKFTGGVGVKNWRKFDLILNKEHPIQAKLFKKSDELFKKTCPSLVSTHSLQYHYASGYLFGTHHEIHSDYEKDWGITVMFYLNKVWDLSYGGETIFINNSGDITNSVIPKPGRVVIFDGNIPHAAREVSRTCIELRMVATFKYGLK